MCVLLTLFKLFDVAIVFRMVSRLYFLMSSFAFFLRVLHTSVYTMQSLVVFLTISLRFFISALVGVDNLDLSHLVFCLAMFVAVCWIISVMFSFRVSISSSSCRAVNLFFSSSWNLFFLIPIFLVSTFGGFFFLSSFFLSAFVSHLMLLINILWSLPMFMRFMIYIIRLVSHDEVNLILRFSVRASPCPSPLNFLLE